MKKRWTALLLALILAAALLPAPVRAAAEEGSAGARLTGANREIYHCLREEAAKIAAGSRTSTAIQIPNLDSLSWTLEELGAAGGSRENILAKLEEKFSQAVDIMRVYNCLTVDCPYEMFWRSDQFTWGYSLARAGERAYIKDLTIRLEVAEDYRGGSATTVSSSKIAAANRAMENARAIVDKYEEKSDFEKLTAYREEICRLVSYNMDAAWDQTPYGDPWQLVYVFDGDPKTNVVCEGYAKAFQYLCELSEFDGNVVCRIASGTMGGGSHMWNVVQMWDGKNYLADVTNCDSGAVGADDKLFLCGAAASADGRTYTVSKGTCRAVYTYDEDQKGMYADGYLALSGTDYVDAPASAAVSPQPDASARFTDVPQGQYYSEPVAWAVGENITNGTTDTTFSPFQPCTHGQILTFLWRAAGEPSPAGSAPESVKPGAYYYDAVRWAAGKGMLEAGFDPESGCVRADAVRYIWHAFDGPDSQVASFTDVPADASYAHAVGWAVLEGITNGATDDTFEPDVICSRGQIVTFLYRAYH